MTYNDHRRIALRFLEQGTVSRADRRVLEANDPLGHPLGLALSQAVRQKVEGLVHEARRAPALAPLAKAKIRQFAKSPVGAAFIQA